MDLVELARAYWAAPQYGENEDHPIDRINEVLDSGTAADVSTMLRALALSAPDAKGLAYIGTWCIESLEFERGQGAPGESVRLLVAAGLDSGTLLRVISGVYPDMLELMGAPNILGGILEPEQISWLIDPGASGRRDWL